MAQVHAIRAGLKARPTDPTPNSQLPRPEARSPRPASRSSKRRQRLRAQAEHDDGWCQHRYTEGEERTAIVPTRAGQPGDDLRTEVAGEVTEGIDHGEAGR